MQVFFFKMRLVISDRRKIFVLNIHNTYSIMMDNSTLFSLDVYENIDCGGLPIGNIIPKYYVMPTILLFTIKHEHSYSFNAFTKLYWSKNVVLNKMLPF